MAQGIVHIRIDEDGFRTLVSGGVLTARSLVGDAEAKIILADIGWGRMADIIDDLMSRALYDVERRAKENEDGA